jgi:hypothetical protein
MINEDLLNADGLDLTTLKMTGDKFYNGEPFSAYRSKLIKVGNRYYPQYSNNDGLQNQYNSLEQFFDSKKSGGGNAGGGGKIDPELVKAGIATATAIASGIAQKRAGQVCKKPLLPESFVNRAKWSAYKQCLAREAEKAERERREAEERRRAEEERLRREAEERANRGNFTPEDDKILGMPKGLAIGLGVLLGVAVIGGGAYLILKNK